MLASTPYVPNLAFSEALAVRAQDWLHQTYKVRQQPVIAGRLLAYIVRLHNQRMPWPGRVVAAAMVKGSVWGVDSALQMAMARDLITLVVQPEVIEGRTRLVRYYRPTGILADALGRKGPTHDAAD